MQIAVLALCGIVFALWIFLMFRIIFAMRRRVVIRTGKAMPGPIEALREWGIWLRDPSFQSERRQLLFATLAVFAATYLASLFAVVDR